MFTAGRRPTGDNGSSESELQGVTNGLPEGPTADGRSIDIRGGNEITLEALPHSSGMVAKRGVAEVPDVRAQEKATEVRELMEFGIGA